MRQILFLFLIEKKKHIGIIQLYRKNKPRGTFFYRKKIYRMN